jgi:hypothetical protein
LLAFPTITFNEGKELKPPQQARGVTSVEPGFGNILGYNCAGPDDRSVTDRHRKDGGIGSDTYVIAKLCCPPEFGFSGRPTAGEQIIDEHRAVRDEAIVTDGYQVTDEGVRLNPAAFANICTFLYLNEGANEAVIVNFAAVEIDRLYDSYVLTKANIGDSDMTKIQRTPIVCCSLRADGRPCAMRLGQAG